MPILTLSAGIVTAVRGKAFLRLHDGTLAPVKVGDVIEPGQQIVTDDAGLVQIGPLAASGAAIVPAEAVAPTGLDRAITALEDRNPDEAPAAGLTGGAAGSLQPGLRVDRVSEEVGGQSFDTGTRLDAAVAPVGSSADQREALVRPDAMPPLEAAPPESPPYLVVYGTDTVEGQPAHFTVNLTQPAGAPVTVSLALQAGVDPVESAKPGVDTETKLEFFNATTAQWELVSGNLTFQPGATEIQVRVATLDDQQVEPVEYIRLEASVVSGMTVNQVSGNEAAISDNDKPYLVVYSQDTTEGQAAEFTVNLTQPSTGPVTVSLALLAGLDPAESATPLGDTDSQLQFFNAASGEWQLVGGDLTFQPGETQIQVRVATLDDQQVEPVEYIRLEATVVSGETANPVSGNEAAITDNDKPYLVVYGQDTVEGEYSHFTVGLTQAATDPVTVALAQQSSSDPAESATPGVDTSAGLEYFNAANGQWEVVGHSLSFQPGETAMQVRVATVDDRDVEPLEYIRLEATVLSGDTANHFSGNEAAITDNEGRTVTGSDADEYVAGQAGPDTVMGLAGNDVIVGGRGDDLLVGGDGADVFAWQLGDASSISVPVDRIQDFDLAPPSAGGDALDLRDLLQGETAANLDHYLRFDTTGPNTIIKVSVLGDFAGGGGTVAQELVLEGVNLRTDLGLDLGASDSLVVARMLADNKLWVDQA